MKEEALLTSSEKRTLLKIARQAIESELLGVPMIFPDIKSASLLLHRGAFVTIQKHRELRGCIGIFTANKPLFEVVADMAISAAFQDPRFYPLRKDELEEIDIEISALTPLRQITDMEEIQVGIHGIYIVSPYGSGVLLPQVATEYGWDRITFLDQTCRKAGLSKGCWKESTSKVYIFSAEIFSEED